MHAQLKPEDLIAMEVVGVPLYNVRTMANHQPEEPKKECAVIARGKQDAHWHRQNKMAALKGLLNKSIPTHFADSAASALMRYTAPKKKHTVTVSFLQATGTGFTVLVGLTRTLPRALQTRATHRTDPPRFHHEAYQSYGGHG